MTSFRQEIPSGGVDKVDLELWRGDITVRSAGPGEQGYVESNWELEVTTRGDTLFLRQPVDVRRPLDLADVIGEQKVRIEIEGTVLFDKQIRHGGGDVTIALPSSIRDVNCRTAGGDIRLAGMEAAVEAHSGKGNIDLSGGRGRALATTPDGEIRVFGWHGAVQVQTGKGNLALSEIHGDLEAKTGKGEIGIEEATSKVTAQTGHGNVVAGRLAGDSSLSTGHGDIVVSDLDRALLEASTAHGKVVLGGSLAGGRVKTGHGEIVCRLDAAEGDLEFHTGWGNISLDLDGEVAVRIDASTRRGSIRSNLPLVRVGTSGPEGYFNQRMVGTSPGSEPVARINLNTKAGDIRIVRREAMSAHTVTAIEKSDTASDGQAAPDQAVLAAAESSTRGEMATIQEVGATPIVPEELTPANRHPARAADLELEVLGALSRGEISVDEALVLIEKIKPDNQATGEATS